MKNFKLLCRNLESIKSINARYARTKNDWDSIKSFPYNPIDEHEEPKQEDIIREIFDRDYYKFGFKASADRHDEVDMYNQYRQWQHLYVHPKEPVLGWPHGSAILKYLYLLLPVTIFFFYYKILQVNLKILFLVKQ